MCNKVVFILSLFLAAASYAQSNVQTSDLLPEDASVVLQDLANNQPQAEETAADSVNVDTNRSLTENLKNNAPEDERDEAAGGAKNWVGQILSTVQTEDDHSGKSVNPLSSIMAEQAGKNRKSNASIFDISGVMLRMSYQQAEAALLKRGFKKTMQKLDIPNFIRWRFEDKCRAEGVVGYERLNGCVIKLSRDNKYEYVAQAQFNKYDTQETVNFYLTSTFTNNKVYKITYRTEAANNAGNSAKAIYLRNIKVYDFWKKINQKYGAPDNREDVIWSLGNNKPYMKAATGMLLLEDPMLRELDYTRMSREDQRFMNTDLYTF